MAELFDVPQAGAAVQALEGLAGDDQHEDRRDDSRDEDGPEVFEDTKKSAMAPNRNRAAGRTVSARTQRRHSAAKSRIMPMMLPDT